MEQRLSFTVFTPANIITYFGVILTLLLYYLIATSSLLAFPVFLLAASTDALDGFVAKNTRIQKFFGGRGVSTLGKTIDPIRDFLLKGSIFFLTYISDCSLIPPVVIVVLVIITLVQYSLPLNRLKKEVTVLQIGRELQILECVVIGTWFLMFTLDKFSVLPFSLNDIADYILILLMITNLIRLLAYRDAYYQELREKLNITSN